MVSWDFIRKMIVVHGLVEGKWWVFMGLYKKNAGCSCGFYKENDGFSSESKRKTLV